MGGRGDGNRLEDYSAFTREVMAEIDSEEEILVRLSLPRKGSAYGQAGMAVIIAGVVTLVLLKSDLVYLWFVVALLLYSYNFLILLLPTTTVRIRPDESGAIKDIDNQRKWLAIKLLSQKPRLAVEIGLTVYLAGMVPLSLSFSVIFGLAVSFAVYFGAIAHLITVTAMQTIVIQVCFIILFYLVVRAIQPQAQGFARIAGSYRQRLRTAQTKGRLSLIMVVMIVVAVTIAISVVTIGAMLLPGMTVSEFTGSLARLPAENLLPLALIASGQFAVMRYFQGIGSRRMAVDLLNRRLDRLKNDILPALNAERTAEPGRMDLDKIERDFYSIVIYDIVEHDFFGRSPIYLVGPRLRYVLDDRVIAKLQ